MKQKPFLENLLVWRGLPNLLVLIGLVVSLIFFLASIASKEMQIETEHRQILDAIINCQQQINELKGIK